MVKNLKAVVLWIGLISLTFCSRSQHIIYCGAEKTDAYFPLLEGKKCGLVINHSSLLRTTHGYRHLLDTLLNAGFTVVKIYTPEHGFTGTADAGKHIDNTVEESSAIPIISLYGDKKKPSPEDLEGVETILFDIQDVGARFYTYISTLHYIMEACAENDIPLIVLDRPNPNGFYVDGPVLQDTFRSFVGMHPGVPIVHGMTVGEYAQMINGEGWLAKGITCDVTVIPCENYDHNFPYKPYTSPSPNLPNSRAILLYPSLCLFEGTVISVGRGTDKPFQVYGHPLLVGAPYQFTPESRQGALNPKYKGQTCYGFDLSYLDTGHFIRLHRIDLSYLIGAYEKLKDKVDFFNDYFDKLAGTARLRKQIINGRSEAEIRQSWMDDLEKFRSIRKKYLLYPDFYHN